MRCALETMCSFFYDPKVAALVHAALDLFSEDQGKWIGVFY